MFKKIFCVILTLTSLNLFSMEPQSKLPIIYHDEYASKKILDELINNGITKLRLDEMVFSILAQYKIPVAMVLGPSSSPTNWETNYKSILNILKIKNIRL